MRSTRATVLAALTFFVVMSVGVTWNATKLTSSRAQASQSCPNPQTCPNPVIPLHQPLTSLCGSGIGNNVNQTQMRDGVSLCQDSPPTHVGIALYGCGDNLANALVGLDCVAVHYWNIGTTAQSAWAAAQVNTTLTGVTPGGASISVRSLMNIQDMTVLTIDSGANQETVTASCPTGCGNPFAITPALMRNHTLGVNVIGAFLQCTDIQTNPVDPYDDRVAWLTNTLYGKQPPNPNPISIDDSVNLLNSFVNHWNNSASGDGGQGSNMANEAFEYGNTCGGGAVGLPKLKWADNLASPLFAIAISSELRGLSSYPGGITIDGYSIGQSKYHWMNPGSTVENGTVCPSNSCTEPTDHINEYPVIAWDRAFTVPQCLTGSASQQGAFLEIDPTLGADGSILTLDPNLDSARLRATARLDHAPTTGLGKWIDGTSVLDGRPFLFIANGGDCQDDSQANFQSSFAWQSGNTLALNSEDPFVDTKTTCNVPSNHNKEPDRRAGPAQFALNSETIFQSHHEVWQNESSCEQPWQAGPAGGTSDQNNHGGSAQCLGNLCAGGLDDVSLRYWILGNEMLFSDYRYTWSRHNFIGPTGNDPSALDVVGEDFIVALYPVKVVATYVPGMNPSGNGCTGNGPGGQNYGVGESGGILSVAILNPNTCGSSGGGFFKNSPTVSQQWRECYIHGVYFGPCAAVGNYTDSKYMDTTLGLTQTFGTELVPYAHILDLNDANQTGPCPAASPGAVGGTYVSACAQDVFEGGGQLVAGSPCLKTTGAVANFNKICLDVTDYAQETVVKSGALNQGTGNQCTQGIGLPATGNLTVCPKEYVILFP